MAWFDPRTWTDEETVTAAMMNGIRDSLKAIGDPWTAYTPTWDQVTTNPTLNNGTVTGAYQQMGKTIFYRLSLTIGSTTAFGTGGFRFSLPVNTGGLLPQHSPMGDVTMLDVSTGTVYTRMAVNFSTSSFVLRDAAGTAVTQAVPVTFAVGDRVAVIGQYEIA